MGEISVDVTVKVYSSTPTVSQYDSAVYVPTMDVSADDIILSPITYLINRAEDDIINRDDSILITRR